MCHKSYAESMSEPMNSPHYEEHVGGGSTNRCCLAKITYDNSVSKQTATFTKCADRLRAYPQICFKGRWSTSIYYCLFIVSFEEK